MFPFFSKPEGTRQDLQTRNVEGFLQEGKHLGLGRDLEQRDSLTEVGGECHRPSKEIPEKFRGGCWVLNSSSDQLRCLAQRSWGPWVLFLAPSWCWHTALWRKQTPSLERPRSREWPLQSAQSPRKTEKKGNFKKIAATSKAEIQGMIIPGVTWGLGQWLRAPSPLSVSRTCLHSFPASSQGPWGSRARSRKTTTTKATHTTCLHWMAQAFLQPKDHQIRRIQDVDEEQSWPSSKTAYPRGSRETWWHRKECKTFSLMFREEWVDNSSIKHE